MRLRSAARQRLREALASRILNFSHGYLPLTARYRGRLLAAVTNDQPPTNQRRPDILPYSCTALHHDSAIISSITGEPLQLMITIRMARCRLGCTSPWIDRWMRAQRPPVFSAEQGSRSRFLTNSIGGSCRLFRSSTRWRLIAAISSGPNGLLETPQRQPWRRRGREAD